jgi:hypothetical protein
VSAHKCARPECPEFVHDVNQYGGDLGRPRAYCSDYCRQAAYRDRKAARWRRDHTYPAGTSWECLRCRATVYSAALFVGVPKGCPFCGAELETQARLFVSSGPGRQKTVDRNS